MSDAPDGSVPVTVISGPLGAGKTTLVNDLLDAPGGRRIAVVVNDMGEVNVDAELLDGETDDGVIDLSNGCICCRLQGDLLTEVTRLLDRRTFDVLVVEASGISEPVPIARALTVGTDAADPPDGIHLDTMVSVVDAFGFWKAFDPDERLPGSAEPERPLAEVMIDQIEFCDVLLLNKCDMVPDSELDGIEASVRELQPRAEIRRTTYSDVDPAVVLDTGRFDFDAARRHQGWKAALAAAENGGDDGGEAVGADDHDHDHADAHAVESFVYRRDEPFHPERFDAWLDEWSGDIVRSKGFAWLASRPETVVGVSQAGPAVQAGPIGEWDDDRATRLVVIGRDLDVDGITATLDACLATDAERSSPASPASDPFPRDS